MSTYHSTFARRKSTKLVGWASYCVTCCVLSGLIAVLFTLFLAPVASAMQRDAISQQEYLARTGVSLVRIVATYGATPPSGGISLTPPPGKANPPSTNNLPVTCMGLGVVVAGGGKTLWVVTDGSLVSITNQLPCSATVIPNPVAKALKLSTLKIYVNNVYNNTLFSTPILGDPTSIRCSDTRNCSNGVSLFSFQSSAVLPSIDLSNATRAAQGDIAAIQLSQPSTSIAPPATANDAPNYVTPTAFSLNETNIGAPTNLESLETGALIVDKSGFLNGLYLKNTTQAKLFKTPGIADFLKAQGIASDSTATTVSTSWNSGISAYYQVPSDHAKANSDFKTAYSTSSDQFQGAQPFIEATTNNGSSTGTTGGAQPKSSLPFDLSIPSLLLIAVIAGVVVLLIILLFLLNSFFRREQRRKDLAEAENMAEVQAQQIREMEAQSAPAPARPIPPRATQNIQQQAAPYPIQQQSMNGVVNAPPLVSMSPVAPIQASAYADYPTVDMNTSEIKQNGIVDMDKTQPFPQGVQRVGRDGEEHIGFEAITSTDPGIKRKYKPNEDSLFALRGMRNANGHMQQIGLFVVADGMGGHANGQDASRLAIQTIIDHIVPRLMHGNDVSEAPEKLLVESVQLANQAVHQHNIENNADMGTTVTATLVVDATAHVANVGDSRTYLYRTSQLAKVTRDHSVVASLVDAGIIQPDDIYTHPKRNQIYRSLGEKPFVEVDPFEVQLQPGDKLLLCSDGLWDMVRDPEIKHVLETPTPDPQQLGDNLIKAALKGGGEDNVSVIVINVVDHLPKHPTPGLETIYIQENVKMPPLS